MSKGKFVGWTSLILMTVAAMQVIAQQDEGPILRPKNPPMPAVANPQAVCKFLSERMQSSLPQVPTLCSGTHEVSGYYEINVFTPKDVLEGEMRRSWSSALFQALEATVLEKSLNGACSAKELTCFVNVTDSFMARAGIHYRFILSKGDVSELQTLVKTFHGTEFSDPWYLTWWETLMTSKESEHPQSKENADLIGKMACEDYLHASAAAFRLRNKPPPSCYVLLTTYKAIYIEMAFSDFVGALVSNNLADLPKTVGRAFDGTAYDGQVILKSPYMSMADGTQQRVYYTIPLRDLEFLYEEIQSGTRSEASAHIILVSRYRGEGQTTMTSLFRSDQKDSLLFRDAAVVNVRFGQNNTVSLQTTDGAEWRMSEDNLLRCGVSPGSEISLFAVLEKPPALSVQRGGEPCRLDVAFVSGW